MLGVFAIAIFLSAALLFQVQPFTGKILLPLVGGSPAVWNTCMVFFQGVLLLGYLYSHLIARYLKPQFQAVVHGAVLASAFWLLPTPIDIAPPDPQAPVTGLLIILFGTVGLPFFVVSTTGPLLQRWFSKTGHKHAHDPYFLYAASNAGSLLGLLAYPILVEPNLTRSGQADLWMWGYAVFVAAAVACAVFLLARTRGNVATPATPEPMRGGADVKRAETGSAPTSRDTGPNTAPVTRARRLRWIALAFVPSSLMLGVTQIITTDVAAVPLLWIVPLLIYLLSFIVVFSPRVRLSGRTYGLVLAPAAIAAALMIAGSINNPISLIVAVHLAAFAAAAFMCHRLMAEDRPAADHLTEFYLWMSVGGVLGGIFNGLVAPVAFNGLYEYPLVLGLAIILRPQARELLREPRAWLLAVLAAAAAGGVALLVASRIGASINFDRKLQMVIAVGVILLLVWAWRGGLRLALAVPVAVITAQLYAGVGVTLYRERTFFGIHKVVVRPAGSATIEDVARDPTLAWHLLYHGTTTHGMQSWSPQLKQVATTYYHPQGPMGQIIAAAATKLPDRGIRAVVIGLGAGSIAAYARPQDQFVFFEIDEAVIRIATTPELFSYLPDARGQVQVLHGDGRLLAANQVPPGTVDLLIVDAFSSDSIPMHLLTLEAVRDVYLEALAPGGMLAIHISNRHLDISKPIAAIAGELGLTMLQMQDGVTEEEKRTAKSASDWVILVRRPDDAGLLLGIPQWERRTRRAGDPLWTDDFSNILSVIKGL